MKSDERRPYRMTNRAEAANATAERILDATTELFWERPTDQLVLRDVAEAGRGDGADRAPEVRRQGGACSPQRPTGRCRGRPPSAPCGPVTSTPRSRSWSTTTRRSAPRCCACWPRSSPRPTLAEFAQQGRALHREWCRTVFADTLGAPGRRGPRAPTRPARRRVRRLHLEAAPARRRAQPPPDPDRPPRAARAAPGHHPRAMRNHKGAPMSTILAYTSPALGHLFPMTPLLLELRSRGHRVHVRTLAGQVDRMESLGLEASASDPRVETIENVDWQAGNARAALGSVRWPTFVARGKYDAPDLEQAIAEVGPTCSSWTSTPGVPRSRPRPRACPTSRSAPTRRRCGPWARRRSAPGSSRAGSAGPLRDGLLRPIVMGAAEKAMGPGIAELRAAHGLPPVRSADEFFRRAPLMLVDHRRAVRVPPRGLGRRHPDDRRQCLGAAR